MDDAHAARSEGTWVRLLLRRGLLVAGALGAALALSTAMASEAEAGPLDGLLDPLSGTLDEVLTPVTDDVIAPVLDGAVAPVVDDVVAPVVDEIVAPVVDEVAAPVVEEIAEPVAPVVEDVVAPVVGGVLEPLSPVVDDVVKPVIETVTAPVADVVTPVTDAVAPVLGVTEPVVEAVQPIVAPVGELLVPVTDLLDPLDPVTDSGEQVPSEPAPGGGAGETIVPGGATPTPGTVITPSTSAPSGLEQGPESAAAMPDSRPGVPAGAVILSDEWGPSSGHAGANGVAVPSTTSAEPVSAPPHSPEQVPAPSPLNQTSAPAPTPAPGSSARTVHGHEVAVVDPLHLSLPNSYWTAADRDARAAHPTTFHEVPVSPG